MVRNITSILWLVCVELSHFDMIYFGTHRGSCLEGDIVTKVAISEPVVPTCLSKVRVKVCHQEGVEALVDGMCGFHAK